MSTDINYSRMWLGSLDQKNHTWKNCEAQSLVNQILKDETRKKNQLNEKI
jgi:hypothetical protein